MKINRGVSAVVLLSLINPWFPAAETALTGASEQSAEQPLSQWKWGAATNGLVAGVLVEKPPGADETTRVAVYILAFETNAAPPISGDDTHSKPRNDYFGEMPMSRGWGVYFKATNSFCGPVELTQESRKLPLLKPGLCSTQAYPEFFRSSQLGHIPGNPFKARVAEPLLGRLPKLTSFQLEDCFDLKPGIYRLTVWPKIYKRLRDDDDLFQRIDLPPISARILKRSAH